VSFKLLCGKRRAFFEFKGASARMAAPRHSAMSHLGQVGLDGLIKTHAEIFRVMPRVKAFEKENPLARSRI
jgi:hypothetical protein